MSEKRAWSHGGKEMKHYVVADNEVDESGGRSEEAFRIVRELLVYTNRHCI